MLHQFHGTDGHDGSKNSMLKRILTLERELEIKNREIVSLQEACKKLDAPNGVVEEANNKLAAERKIRLIMSLCLFRIEHKKFFSHQQSCAESQ